MKKALTTVLLLATVAMTGCSQGGEETGLSLSSSTGVKEAATFEPLANMPDGWASSLTSEIPESEKAVAEASFKKNPVRIDKADKSCTYTQQSIVMPSYLANRGDDFLSRSYIYEQAQSGGEMPKGTIEQVPVNTNIGKVAFAYSTYSTTAYMMGINNLAPADGKTEIKPGKIYRATAVRVFDSLVDANKAQVAEAPPGLYGSDSKKGLPGIALTYECSKEESFNEEEAKKLFAETRINIQK